jgi:hypothetical protein
MKLQIMNVQKQGIKVYVCLCVDAHALLKGKGSTPQPSTTMQAKHGMNGSNGKCHSSVVKILATMPSENVTKPPAAKSASPQSASFKEARPSANGQGPHSQAPCWLHPNCLLERTAALTSTY